MLIGGNTSHSVVQASHGGAKERRSATIFQLAAVIKPLIKQHLVYGVSATAGIDRAVISLRSILYQPLELNTFFIHIRNIEVIDEPVVIAGTVTRIQQIIACAPVNGKPHFHMANACFRLIGHMRELTLIGVKCNHFIIVGEINHHLLQLIAESGVLPLHFLCQCQCEDVVSNLRAFFQVKRYAVCLSRLETDAAIGTPKVGSENKQMLLRIGHMNPAILQHSLTAVKRGLLPLLHNQGVQYFGKIVLQKHFIDCGLPAHYAIVVVLRLHRRSCCRFLGDRGLRGFVCGLRLLSAKSPNQGNRYQCQYRNCCHQTYNCFFVFHSLCPPLLFTRYPCWVTTILSKYQQMLFAASIAALFSALVGSEKLPFSPSRSLS